MHLPPGAAGCGEASLAGGLAKSTGTPFKPAGWTKPQEGLLASGEDCSGAGDRLRPHTGLGEGEGEGGRGPAEEGRGCGEVLAGGTGAGWGEGDGEARMQSVGTSHKTWGSSSEQCGVGQSGDLPSVSKSATLNAQSRSMSCGCALGLRPIVKPWPRHAPPTCSWVTSSFCTSCPEMFRAWSTAMALKPVMSWPGSGQE